MTATPRAARSRRGAQGWVPNQHGAWAMVLVPWLLGFATVVRDGGHPAPGLVLLACWLAGYFLFFAASQWLRSRFKPRYLPAVRAYAVVTAILGLGVLALRPSRSWRSGPCWCPGWVPCGDATSRRKRRASGNSSPPACSWQSS